ncbi:hypothetical protein NLI96_g3035 [Meripilus lineatus]|uniref:Uncharacterized protein n=1 Tax=Meripilus lineatus TaxID=2056292 RepID=A0AAD5V7L7_9APHY|nr:hypothetical protein NLI96_g3035 [Physisporinus lineatus]
MRRLSAKSRRRSSSRIHRWVYDQQSIRSSHDHDSGPSSPDSTHTPPLSSGCHPYLAYPHLSVPTVSVSVERPDDVFAPRGVSLIPGPDSQHDKRDSQRTIRTAAPSAPSTPRKTGSSQPSGIFNTPTSLRKINLSFSHTRSPSSTTTTTQSQTPPRPSLFRRPATATDPVTNRNSALSSSFFSAKPTRAVSVGAVPPPTTWKPRRTVLGHFLTATEGQTDDSSPPRPSTSSTLTHSSSATYAGNSADAAGTPPKLKPESHNNHLQLPANYRSTPSLWSLPTDASHMYDPPDSTKTIARDPEKDTVGTLRSIKAHSAGVPGLGAVAQILGSPKRKKKRKLIISGIPLHDEKRYEGVRKWCEGFGEVNTITRNSNGDLHVDFRRAEVAETVCRLHARVFIGGVGSVGLSWFTGKRP